MGAEREGFLRTPFHCQLDNERHPATEDRHQCMECGRVICCDCFNAQKAVGMLSCPFCNGKLEFQKSEGSLVRIKPPTSLDRLSTTDLEQKSVISSMFEEAKKHQSVGNFEQAQNILNAIIEKDPQNANAWNEKGRALEEVNNPLEALNCYTTALELDPSNPTYWNNKGYALDLMNRHEAAIQCYNKALELDPKDVDIWINKSAAIGQLGRYDEALEYADKAIQLDSRAVDAWFNRGMILEVLGHKKSALECYERMIELNPDDTEALDRKKTLLKQIK